MSRRTGRRFSAVGYRFFPRFTEYESKPETSALFNVLFKRYLFCGSERLPRSVRSLSPRPL